MATSCLYMYGTYLNIGTKYSVDLKDTFPWNNKWLNLPIHNKWLNLPKFLFMFIWPTQGYDENKSVYKFWIICLSNCIQGLDLLNVIFIPGIKNSWNVSKPAILIISFKIAHLKCVNWGKWERELINKLITYSIHEVSSAHHHHPPPPKKNQIPKPHLPNIPQESFVVEHVEAVHKCTCISVVSTGF